MADDQGRQRIAPGTQIGSYRLEALLGEGGMGTTVCICGNRALDAPPAVTWSADGRTLYVSLVGGQNVYAISLRPGEILPPLPKGGIRSAEDVLKLPGVKLLPASGEFPGPGSLYAFPKFTSQPAATRVRQSSSLFHITDKLDCYPRVHT